MVQFSPFFWGSHGMSVPELVRMFAPWAVALALAIGVFLRIMVSIHVVLTKRQTRAATGWVGLVLLAPFGGSLLYLVFGINRIQRRAAQLRKDQRLRTDLKPAKDDLEVLKNALGPATPEMEPLVRLVGEVTRIPLEPGNHIEPLVNGDSVFPAMLEAIRSARHSIALSTYIFYDDSVGQAFTQALGEAVTRGVSVRVLIDSLGSRYGWRSNVRNLRNAKVPVETFIPTLVPTWLPFLNLRNHRKILVVDGSLAFTGGMNIDARFLSDSPEVQELRARAGTHDLPHHDLHFRVQGPVVSSLMQVFAEDWLFARGERLQGNAWYPTLYPAGTIPARCVADGPEDDVDPLLKSILGGVGVARRTVSIITPYFIPDDPLLSALEVAALRGVAVDIFIPQKSNLRIMNWAMPPFLDHALNAGCQVFLVPPPFDHTKLMVVDDVWVFFGSANIDSRSLRLNFEVNMECYGVEVARKVQPLLQARRQLALPLTEAALEARAFPVKVRDAFASLLAPYI